MKSPYIYMCNPPKFQLPKSSVCCPEEIRLKRRDFEGHYFDTYLAAKLCFIWRNSVQLKIGGKEKNLQLSFTK